MLATPLNEPPPALPAMPDDQYLARAAQNDLQAFTTLYERHARLVYRYLLARVGDVNDAQDLTSQTFMAAMQSLKNYRAGQPFPGWLIGIARNKAADHFRRQRPNLDLAPAEQLADDGADELDEHIDQQMEVDRVVRLLAALTPDRAEAVSLRIIGGLEVAEVAQVMGRSEANARMLVFRGLRDLQTQFKAAREELR